MVDWWITAGLGAMWIGGLIVWVARLPRQLRKANVPTEEKGSEAAFKLFWLDQYGWLGLTLLTSGLASVMWGWLQ